MRKSLQKILYLVVAASILLGAALPLPTTAKTIDPQTMEVHFLDVGQGDSTLITCDGHAMLIDAGDDTKGTAIQNYLKKQNIKNLDYLILTHPDADHIGGAPVIITKFDITKVFVSNFEKDNQTYQKLIQALDDKRLKAITPAVSSKYSLGTAEFTILAPNDTYDTPNDSSIALLLKNGENTFLFTGDAGADAEKDILSTGINISADVYKVGHHGSKSSTSKEFFRTVDPTYAVISCGEGNYYGLPHAEVLNTLRINGVAVYRTDEDGTIIATSDGKNITFNVPASKTWKAGEPTKNSAKSTTGTKSIPEAKASETAPAPAPQMENSTPAVEEPVAEAPAPATTELTYVLNVKTKKFHKPTCNSLPTTNRQDSSESRDSIIAQGYVPCKRCNP
ncbi:MAG: MBL fold metallo-hydrolase [Lachnospiraceae bacterium]|nr:MBL fold metallo-hydrolase [Lachnospiraceae bacterium]